MSRRRHFLQSLGRHLVVFALFAQLMAPVALAARSGLDVASLFCAPSGVLSEEALAEAEALLSDLLGDEQEDNGNPAHCPLCVLVHGVPLPEHHLTPLIGFAHQDATTPSFETVVVHRPHGPPLGLRAPPPTSL